jgi:tetratricopeptide (TPR) repeat protein
MERLAREALPVFEQAGDLAGLASAWISIAIGHHHRCQFEAEAEAAALALEYSERCGDEAGRRYAFLLASAARLFGPTPAVEALRWLDDHSDLELSTPWSWNYRGLLIAMLGRYDEAKALFADARARHEELGLRAWVGTSAQSRGRVEMNAGDFAAAERELREGCEILEQLGERGWQSTVACMLAMTLVELGQDDEAERWAERGRELGADDDAITQVLWRMVKGQVLARRGEHAAAEQLARDAAGLADATDHVLARGDTYLALGQVLEHGGKTDEAVAAIEHAVALFRAKGEVPMAGRAASRLADLKVSSAS